MIRGDLTKLQLDILLLAHEGKTNAEIAADVGSTRMSVQVTLHHIKRKGHRLPEWRPREDTAEREHRVRERRSIAEYKAAPRFTVKGTKKSTGERFTVTSDTRAFAAAHLAAMVGGGA